MLSTLFTSLVWKPCGFVFFPFAKIWFFVLLIYNVWKMGLNLNYFGKISSFLTSWYFLTFQINIILCASGFPNFNLLWKLLSLWEIFFVLRSQEIINYKVYIRSSTYQWWMIHCMCMVIRSSTDKTSEIISHSRTWKRLESSEVSILAPFRLYDYRKLPPKKWQKVITQEVNVGLKSAQEIILNVYLQTSFIY